MRPAPIEADYQKGSSTMTKAEKYLERLKYEKELWQKKLDDLPGDTVSVNHSVYKMASHAATKYATAKYMYKLMSEQDAE
jgi:hypothetical protein|nr:MAG TPA: hypothetical protein [Caudoviricetes sp.]